MVITVVKSSPRTVIQGVIAPAVALSFQRDRNLHLGIIHGNQQDRNSGGGIWSRDDFHDGIIYRG